MKRRHFVQIAASATASLAARPLFAAAARPPRVLVRSAWQSVNIGDIAHTPGALRLLERHWPEAELTLWPRNLEFGARELLAKAFPKVRFVDGVIGKDGQPSTPELARAFADCDLAVHASAAHFSASADFAAWRRITGKPYGVLGITFDPVSGMGGERFSEGGTLAALRTALAKVPPSRLEPGLRELVDGAAFLFLRDTLSRDAARHLGVKPRVLEFAPDTVFGFDLRDDTKAEAFLRASSLERGKFVCVIPRLRYTPYHHMKEDRRYSPTGARTDSERTRDAINARTGETDHARLRDMIVAWTKATGLKVLVCAEMTYQVDLGRTHLVEKLPADVRRSVVWRENYWMPDEAASVYARSLCVVGIEPHSLIMALAAGTPVMHVRQPTDTFKGHMFRDIGLGDWLLEIEEHTGAQLAAVLHKITGDPAAARARVREAMAGVEKLQGHMIATARAAIRI
ncbi:MAG: polysaccharide pyruvyl transferase family protein [Opitutaceae bacterium]|nr:polysaccharide pyruvyl transferase family protein [Opitutaceae bacterium]